MIVNKLDISVYYAVVPKEVVIEGVDDKLPEQVNGAISNKNDLLDTVPSDKVQAIHAKSFVVAKVFTFITNDVVDRETVFTN